METNNTKKHFRPMKSTLVRIAPYYNAILANYILLL
jgi:hypothetical protein